MWWFNYHLHRGLLTFARKYARHMRSVVGPHQCACVQWAHTARWRRNNPTAHVCSLSVFGLFVLWVGVSFFSFSLFFLPGSSATKTKPLQISPSPVNFVWMNLKQRHFGFVICSYFVICTRVCEKFEAWTTEERISQQPDQAAADDGRWPCLRMR